MKKTSTLFTIQLSSNSDKEKKNFGKKEEKKKEVQDECNNSKSIYTLDEI